MTMRFVFPHEAVAQYVRITLKPDAAAPIALSRVSIKGSTISTHIEDAAAKALWTQAARLLASALQYSSVHHHLARYPQLHSLLLC
jgi:hypothetical protein